MAGSMGELLHLKAGALFSDELRMDLALQGCQGKDRLTLSLYRRILADSIWGFAVEGVIQTRNYEKGLDSCLILLRFTEENLDSLPNDEVQTNQIRLYSFLVHYSKRRIIASAEL